MCQNQPKVNRSRGGFSIIYPKVTMGQVNMGHDKSELINVWVHFTYHQSQLIVIHTYTWLTSLKNSRSTDSICIFFLESQDRVDPTFHVYLKVQRGLHMSYYISVSKRF